MFTVDHSSHNLDLGVSGTIMFPEETRLSELGIHHDSSKDSQRDRAVGIPYLYSKSRTCSIMKYRITIEYAARMPNHPIM